MRPCLRGIAIHGALGVLLLVDPAKAQGPLHYGIRLGGGASFLAFPEELQSIQFEPPLQGEVVLKEGLRPVLFAGGFLLVPLGAGFSLEQSLSVTMRGGTLRGSEALTVEGYPGVTVGVEARESYRLTSTDLAILARYTRQTDTRAAFLGAGPEFSYVFHSRGDYSYEAGVGGFAPESITGNTSLLESTQRLNFGVLFEVGAEFPRKTSTVVLEFRFSLGLTDVYEAAVGVDEPRIRHRTFLITLGVMR